MNNARTVKTAVLGALIALIASLFVATPAANAYGGSPCTNGYQPAGKFVQYGVQDVCAHPSVIDFRGFVNPVAASRPEAPPRRFLPEFARLDTNLPPCFQYDHRTYNGYCAPGVLPLWY